MSTVKEVFERFVPASAVDYCCKLWDHYGFEFQIKRSRRTKLGDYRYDPKSKKHTITINNDLNSFSFLVTYLHEVAHLITFEKHGRKVDPHGTEWKNNFVKVAQPMMNEGVFPKPILLALTNYFKNPKASSCSDPILFNVLRKFDLENPSIPLSQIRNGEEFTFNGKLYRKIEVRRTRSVCMALSSGRRYLISEIAPVLKKQD